MMNLNTVIAPVSWELCEPEEGSFDFSLLDAIVQGARENNLKVVLIWFGSWKNGTSTYVPSWVKLDQGGKKKEPAHFWAGSFVCNPGLSDLLSERQVTGISDARDYVRLAGELFIDGGGP